MKLFSSAKMKIHVTEPTTTYLNQFKIEMNMFYIKIQYNIITYLQISLVLLKLENGLKNY